MAIEPGIYNFTLQRRSDHTIPLIFKDSNNLYYISKGKLLTELNKQRLINIKKLSSIISRINNIVFFS